MSGPRLLISGVLLYPDLTNRKSVPITREGSGHGKTARFDGCKSYSDYIAQEGKWGGAFDYSLLAQLVARLPGERKLIVLTVVDGLVTEMKWCMPPFST